jgi:hypothetical protein
MSALRWIGTWALISSLSIVLAYLFVWGWDRQEALRERPPWSKHGYMEREAQPYQLDFAQGRTKTSGHGYYDRRKERGR